MGTNFGMPFAIAGKPVDRSVADGPAPASTWCRPAISMTFGIRVIRGRAFSETATASARSRWLSSTRRSSQRYFADVDPLAQRILVEQLIPGVTQAGSADRMADRRCLPRHQQCRPARRRLSRDRRAAGAEPVAGRERGRAHGRRSRQRTTQPSPTSFDGIDPDLPMVGVQTMEQLVDRSIAPDRFRTAALRQLRRRRPAPGGARDLRRDVVSRRAAHAGNRVAHGARRRAPPRRRPGR